MSCCTKKTIAHGFTEKNDKWLLAVSTLLWFTASLYVLESPGGFNTPGIKDAPQTH